jgi:glycosyltransferase involved in cell wall biosynthesis
LIVARPFRICALVPTYDNPVTIRRVVERVRSHVEAVIVVDDGSGTEGRSAVEELARDSLAHAVFRPQNGGKGAAVKTGFARARAMGYSHALQIDADGQHAAEDVPRFLEVAREHPDALVLGAPRFDGSAPRARRWGRKITQFWSAIETFGPVIADPLCGFRVYPIDRAIEARAWGDAMDFDPEIAVRMVWAGVKVINLPTHVRYLPESEGGVSHFRMGWDNVLISWMHTRMVIGALLRAPGRMIRWLLRRPTE